MKHQIKQLAAATSLVLTLGLVGCANSDSDNEAPTLTDKEQKVVALLESIETGDQAPVAYINPNKYTQHNLAVKDGLAGFGEVLQALPEGSAKADVKRVFEYGEYVVAHTEYNFFGPKAGFDIFRFENGLIVEHWDNLQEIAPPNASGRTQFDGETRISDLDRTDENIMIVTEFVETILMDGTGDISNYIDGGKGDYLQHNPGVADDLEGLMAALGALADAGTPMIYTKHHITLGKGNFVLSVSEGQFLGEHVAFYDLFRLSKGKIVEHWDTIEAIPPQEQWANSNGKFGF
ncbi:hypothetical protein [Ferrimonas sp.]|uniref:nuclear transport factor 2 family protein n=1 Tax=Ferrimonas sp. TaxID=2080861 RepID=UPI003A912036